MPTFYCEQCDHEVSENHRCPVDGALRFAASVTIGAVTDSALLGGLLGGDLVGGIVGDLLGDGDLFD